VGRLECVPGEKLRKETGISHYTLARIHGLALFAVAWLKELASRDQHRPTGSDDALEVCYTLMHYTNPRLLYFSLIGYLDVPVSFCVVFICCVMCAKLFYFETVIFV